MRVCLRLAMMMLLGITVARAEARHSPVAFYMSGGRPLAIPTMTPPSVSWRGTYGLQGGLEIPLGPRKALRIEGTYDEFTFHTPPFDQERESGPARFASVMSDVLFSFTNRSAQVQPYFLSGLGVQWGTIPRPHYKGYYPYEDCRGAYYANSGSYRSVAVRTGLGIALPFAQRFAWFVEGDLSAAFLDTHYDLAFWHPDSQLPIYGGVRFGVKAQ